MKGNTFQPRERLETARAWLTLRSFTEAIAELEQLSPEQRIRPEVLLLRAEIYECAERWSDLELLAQGAALLYPEYRSFFVRWAWAQHRQGRTLQALHLLETVAPRFPTSASVAYTIACFCAAMNRVPEAQHWLSIACRHADDPGAMKLPTLQPDECLRLRQGESPRV